MNMSEEKRAEIGLCLLLALPFIIAFEKNRYIVWVAGMIVPPGEVPIVHRVGLRK